MKVIKILFLTAWTIFFLIGALGNCSHYGLLDWIIIIFIIALPYLIIWCITHVLNKPKKNPTTKQKINFEIPPMNVSLSTNHHTSLNNATQKINTPCNQSTSYVETNNTMYRTDGKPINEKVISEKKIPYSIQTGYAETKDQNISTHNYPQYMDMRIVSNTIPADENDAQLHNNEKLFFQSLHKQLIEAKLSPPLIKFTRMSDGSFNVDYVGLCYVGKINLYQPTDKFAVIKSGNKRATKIYDTLQEAENYVSHNKNYEIEIRPSKAFNSMQYLRGLSTTKNLSNLSVEQCIEYIPYWIRYIKYCKRN